MKRTITTILAVLFFASLFGQGTDDALSFSQIYYQGTAKSLGMGNALGAVGGDMTAVCINPAGMGIYRNSEITTTIGLLDNITLSTYYGTKHSANKFRMNIPNLGYVSSKQRSNYRPLRYTQFGILFNRLNDYNVHTYAKGLNPTSSMIDDYLSQIDGYAQNELQEYFPYTVYPAWQTYLIDLYEDEQGLYYSSPVPQGGIWQGQERTFKGRSEEWSFAGSANFSDRLFLGVSVNLTHIKRMGNRVFEESLPNDSDIDTDFNQWSFTEDLSSNGTGLNAKVGFIWLANSWLRLGGAFHSPNIYSINESWQTETESQISQITRKYISPKSTYEYIFFSPLKWVGSMTFIIGQQGLISFDAEYTNFGAARFKASANDDYDYTPKNEEIKNTFGRTFNFRLGSEWDLGGSYLRCGVGYYGSPFGLGNSNGSVKKASVGISVPVSFSTTFDFAYELTHSLSQHYLYDVGVLDIEPVMHKTFRSIFATTLKVKF